MEDKKCKKCGKIMPNNEKNYKCEYCRNKFAHKMKKIGLVFLTAITLGIAYIFMPKGSVSDNSVDRDDDLAENAFVS